MLTDNSKNYIENYIGRALTNGELTAIEKHCKRYSVSTVCAWYQDWDDFCSDWCDEIGYTKTQARKLLHGGKGEFKVIHDVGILRFEI